MDKSKCPFDNNDGEPRNGKVGIWRCPNLKDDGGDMETERYACAACGGEGFHDPAHDKLRPFPAMLRKMWSGGEVQKWIDENIAPAWAQAQDTINRLAPEPVTFNDSELPGMWSHADFTGGDPDERSYAERERAKAVNIQKWNEVWDLLRYAERQWEEWKGEDAETGDAYCAHTARQHEHYVAALRQILMGEKGNAR